MIKSAFFLFSSVQGMIEVGMRIAEIEDSLNIKFKRILACYDAFLYKVHEPMLQP